MLYLLLAVVHCHRPIAESSNSKVPTVRIEAIKNSLRGPVTAPAERFMDKQHHSLLHTAEESSSHQGRRTAGKFSLSPTAAPTESPTASPIRSEPRVYERPDVNSYHVAEREPCGLFHLSIFCPTTFQGVIGRWLANYLD